MAKRKKLFMKWLACKLVNLAQRLYPESEDVKQFYMRLLRDYMIEGKYVTRVDWAEREDIE